MKSIKKSELKRIVREEIRQYKQSTIKEGIFGRIFDKIYAKKINKIFQGLNVNSDEYKKLDKEVSAVLDDFIKHVEKEQSKKAR